MPASRRTRPYPWPISRDEREELVRRPKPQIEHGSRPCFICVQSVAQVRPLCSLCAFVAVNLAESAAKRRSAQETSRSQVVTIEFQAVPIRSQAFPNAPKQFPNDSQTFPILCLIGPSLNTWPFPRDFGGIMPSREMFDAHHANQDSHASPGPRSQFRVTIKFRPAPLKKAACSLTSS